MIQDPRCSHLSPSRAWGSRWEPGIQGRRADRSNVRWSWIPEKSHFKAGFVKKNVRLTSWFLQKPKLTPFLCWTLGGCRACEEVAVLSMVLVLTTTTSSSSGAILTLAWPTPPGPPGPGPEPGPSSGSSRILSFSVLHLAAGSDAPGTAGSVDNCRSVAVFLVGVAWGVAAAVACNGVGNSWEDFTKPPSCPAESAFFNLLSAAPGSLSLTMIFFSLEVGVSFWAVPWNKSVEIDTSQCWSTNSFGAQNWNRSCLIHLWIEIGPAMWG